MSRNKLPENLRKVVLVRHAHYEGSENANPPISAKGRTQAENLAQRIALALKDETKITIWASPSNRAQSTAKIIQTALKDPPIVVQPILWADGSHKSDFPGLIRQISEFSGPCLVMVSHEPYVRNFPCEFGLKFNWASYAEGVIFDTQGNMTEISHIG